MIKKVYKRKKINILFCILEYVFKVSWIVNKPHPESQTKSQKKHLKSNLNKK